MNTALILKSPLVNKSSPTGFDCIVRYKSGEGPSRSEYCNLADAYDFFNGALFDGTLTPVMITLNHGPRNHLGYFHPDRFSQRGVNADAGSLLSEISLNPKSMQNRTDEDILGTLVHEMAHLWQHEYGRPSRNGYHNGEWGTKMDELGLAPSNTGEPGGKRTGQQMDHFIVKGGSFALRCQELLGRGWKLEWQVPVASQLMIGITPEPAMPKKNKIRYSCPECGQNAWAKPSANLMCGDCQLPMPHRG